MIHNFLIAITILIYGLPCTIHAINSSYPYELHSTTNEEERVERVEDELDRENELQERLIGIVDLAFQYEIGDGVVQDINTARELYQQAVDQGSSTAMFYLARMYQQHSNDATTHRHAKELLERAFEIGNIRVDAAEYTKALVYLGDLYFYGQHIQENIEKAIDYYKQAANRNNIYSILKLGSVYFYGHRTARNIILARLYFEQAASSGNIYALFHQGYIAHIEGNYILAQDLLRQTLNSVTNVTETVLGEAFTFMGRSYLGHYQHQRDYIQAKAYLDRAAQFGHSGALVELGIMHNQGYGIPVDHTQAKDYFKQAAAAGENDALTHLRLMHQLRQGRVTLKEIRLAQQAYDRTQNNSESDHNQFSSKRRRIE